MLDIDDTIDAFRRGTVDFDCKRIVLAQRKKGGERFEGQGYKRNAAATISAAELEWIKAVEALVLHARGSRGGRMAKSTQVKPDCLSSWNA
jgi:hypothetical protein